MTLTSAIPVLRVGDYPAARDFWLSLGFSLSEEGIDPPRFGIFHRDAAMVFVDGWRDADPVPHNGWRVYLHCDDAAALAETLVASGHRPEGPSDTVFGMREMTLRDPAGNLICFGQDLA